MKKFLVICVLAFFFLGAGGSSDVLEGWKSFEKSLSEWMTSLSNMDKRISDIEKNFHVHEKEQADVNQSIANIEKLLANIDAKVNKVEKMSSISGVKDIVKTFEGTLDVFKKRFAELADKLEHQAVKTAALERMYLAAEQPLEPMKKAIAEQKEVVNKMAKVLEDQERSLLVVQQSLKKQTAPIESLAKSIEELNTRTANLESGILIREPEEIAEKEHEAEIKEKAAHSEVHREEAKEPGFADIGKGFFVKNVDFKLFGTSTNIIGEMMNKSDRDYSIADFKVLVFDKEVVLLGGHSFYMKGFEEGSTQTFNEVIVGVEPKNIAKYAIFFTETPLMSDTGGEPFKMIERKLELAMAETKGEHHEEIEEEKPIAKAKELEGFENIGGDFFARNVFFTSFGTSSTVTGEIKNNSKNDYQLARFIIKIYSRDFGIITSPEFSVKSFKSGDIKSFEEIITGILPFEIFRYEIAFRESY